MRHAGHAFGRVGGERLFRPGVGRAECRSAALRRMAVTVYEGEPLLTRAASQAAAESLRKAAPRFETALRIRFRREYESDCTKRRVFRLETGAGRASTRQSSLSPSRLNVSARSSSVLPGKISLIIQVSRAARWHERSQVNRSSLFADQWPFSICQEKRCAEIFGLRDLRVRLGVAGLLAVHGERRRRPRTRRAAPPDSRSA